ncbi:hypothetical protein VAC51_00013 [Variovorax phage VAC_51]|uniref:Uncharacterized protein n=1 Tax=Variovorax phage VAC_51 TaxID=2985242 RepID=A0A9N6WWY4_9CAUD|nr:hypothetical protein VAC51_00013 [Variovorax phage VAC_51]
MLRFMIAPLVFVAVAALAQYQATEPKPAFLPTGSDTVTPEASCFVRNGFATNDDEDSEGTFCQPQQFDI